MVGLGASAGGLAAVRAFLAAVPADTGAAFVVAQHLSPAHASHSTEILARDTTMPVVDARDDIPIEANHVYVAPAGVSVAIAGTRFRFSKEVALRAPYHPIDMLFESIARERAAAGVAVVFSGAGSDGAVGVKFVKESGGVVMAQTPETADYDSMPRHAIASGCVDVVRPAPELADAVTSYLRRLNWTAAGPPGLTGAQAPETLETVLALLKVRAGADFRSCKRGMLARRELLETYAPAAVLIDGHRNILYYHGPTDDYLAQPPGPPTRDLVAQARMGLRARLRTAVAEASEQGRAVQVSDARVRRDGRYVPVRITVTPVKGHKTRTAMLLVAFESPSSSEIRRARAIGDVAVNVHPVIAQLEAELLAARAELRCQVEAQESPAEELQSASEEVLSVNEELQSANEELETSKEELRSLNEELTTANAELHSKIGALEAANDEFDNLLASIDTPTVTVDRDWRVKRYSPASTRLFSLIGADIGRPLSDVASRVVDEHLVDDARAVLAHPVPIEREVCCSQGRWYLRRVLPYRTKDDQIEGLTLTYVDITERVRMTAVLEREAATLRTLLESVPDAMVVVDETGSVKHANSSALTMFGYSHEELLGLDVEQLIPERFRTGHVSARARFGAAPSVRPMGSGLTLHGLHRSGREFPVEVSLGPVEMPAGPMAAAVIRDVTDREELHSMLSAARLESDRASTAKSRFLAAASHDLRQPLQSVRMYLSVLSGGTGDAEALEIMGKMNDSLETITGLLNALLDISKFDSGTVTPEIGEFEVGQVLRQVAADVEPHAREKGLSFRMVHCSCTVRSDPKLLDTLLQNLAFNAIRYTRTGRVLLGCRRSGSDLRIEVWDTGIGIAADKIDKIFEEYVQLDNPARQRDKGVGLGLAIVRQVADLLGHPLRVASSEGRGSLFAVTVPRVFDAAVARASGPEARQQVSAEDNGRISILLIDDDDAIVKAVALLLGTEGFRVQTAGDLDSAMSLLSSTGEQPDVIICDYRLPGDEMGTDAVRQLRETLGTQVPAVILTGDTSTPLKAEANALGALVLSKPVTAETLLHTIRDAIAGNA